MNEDMSRQLAELRVKLFENKISQKRLAKALKIAPCYLNNLLTGKIRSLSFDKFSEIKRVAETIIKERTQSHDA